MVCFCPRFAECRILAGVVLGIGRALGEAMAVIMVSGNAPNMPSLFQSVRFLTTAVASEMGYAAAGLQRQAVDSQGAQGKAARLDELSPVHGHGISSVVG